MSLKKELDLKVRSDLSPLARLLVRPLTSADLAGPILYERRDGDRFEQVWNPKEVSLATKPNGVFFQVGSAPPKLVSALLEDDQVVVHPWFALHASALAQLPTEDRKVKTGKVRFAYAKQHDAKLMASVNRFYVLDPFGSGNDEYVLWDPITARNSTLAIWSLPDAEMPIGSATGHRILKPSFSNLSNIGNGYASPSFFSTPRWVVDKVDVHPMFQGAGLCAPLVTESLAEVPASDPIMFWNVGGVPAEKCYVRAAASLGRKLACADGPKQYKQEHCEYMMFPALGPD